MTATLRHTRLLVVLLFFVVVVDLWVHLDDRPPPALPELADFSADAATGLTLTSGEQVVQLIREGEHWSVTAPYADDADDQRVEAALAILSRGVRADARVDDDAHQRYGLGGTDQVLVEVEGASGPLARVYVGANAGGGSTFIRFPDDDAVYRARIGGRSRYAGTPASWRDHHPLHLDPSQLVRLGLRSDAATLAFSRARQLDPLAAPSPWTLEGDPGFPVDQMLVDAAADALATLRAEDVLAGDHPALDARPLLTVTVGTDSDQEHVVTFVDHREAALARVDGAGPLYRVPLALVQALATPLDQWRDRTLLDLDPEQIVAVRLELDGGMIAAQRDPRTGVWAVVEPARAEVDPRQVAAAVTSLARLRAVDLVDISPGQAGLPSTRRAVLVDATGTQTVLELGDLVPGRDDPPVRHARVTARPDRIGLLDARLWAGITRALGR